MVHFAPCFFEQVHLIRNTRIRSAFGRNFALAKRRGRNGTFEGGMGMLKRILLPWVWATLMASPAGWADEGAPQVRVRDVRATGTGCPSGTSRAALTEDGKTFALLIDEFSARAGSDLPIGRRNCLIEVDLEIPAGWSYALITADYRGFAELTNYATASQRVVYSFDRNWSANDGRGFAFKATPFAGPFSGEYLVHDEIALESAPRSPCSSGRVVTLYLNTLLTARVDSRRAAQASALIALDSVDGRVAQQEFGLAWYRCQP